MQNNRDNKTYPIMSSRYTKELLQSLNGIQLLTIIVHFGMDAVCARLEITQREKTNGAN